jgi:integrase
MPSISGSVGDRERPPRLALSTDAARLWDGRRRAEGNLRPSTYREIERHLTGYLKALHPIPIHKLDRRAIAVELARITDENGAIIANRARGSLVKFLNWCVGEGFIESNAATHTNKNAEVSRSRVLAAVELNAVWHALPEGDYRDIIKLLALTGSRAGEMAGLRWSEIDFVRDVIVLSAARVKNGRTHTISMSATVRAILEARPSCVRLRAARVLRVHAREGQARRAGEDSALDDPRPAAHRGHRDERDRNHALGGRGSAEPRQRSPGRCGGGL